MSSFLISNSLPQRSKPSADAEVSPAEDDQEEEIEEAVMMEEEEGRSEE